MQSLTLKQCILHVQRGAAPGSEGSKLPYEPGVALYAVIGPSGSGKVTLLTMLAGLDLPN
jgi:ABC-type lipoprotein export system ATPase subunit